MIRTLVHLTLAVSISNAAIAPLEVKNAAMKSLALMQSSSSVFAGKMPFGFWAAKKAVYAFLNEKLIWPQRHGQRL